MALTTIKTGGLADNSVTDAKVANAITVTGAQTGITQVGTLSAGTWQGTPITSAYLNASQTAITSVGTLAALTTASLQVNGTSGTNPVTIIKGAVQDTVSEFIRVGRSDSTARYHSIKTLNSATGANNYLSFEVHDASSTTATTEVLKLKGDKSATFAGAIDCNATGNQVNDFAGGIYFSGTDTRLKYNPSNSLANSVLDVYNSSATGYGAYIQAGSSGRYVLNMRDKDGVERYVFDGAGTLTVKTGPVVINSAGSDGQLYLGGTSGSNRMYLARSGGDALLWNVTSGNLKLGTNNTLALTIDSSQNATFAGTIKSDVGFRPTNGTANLLAFVDSNEFNMYNTSGVGDANRQTMHLQYTGTGSQVDIANSELVVVKGTGSTFAGSVTSPSNAKFWVRSDVYTNNDVRDSYNCDGHTHHTTGNLTYSFTTNMPSTVYCLVGSGHYGGGTNDVGNVSWEGGNLAAASCRVQFNSIINYGTGAFAAYDPEEMMLVIFDN
jgi:hypothetical protein